jgi:DNA-binding PadR family transcriptional regulator
MTSAELAILSLIVQEPRYGYQVEQVIKERGMRDWAEIAFSSIYYLLGRLEGKEWIAVEASEEDSAGPARKVYRATDEGAEAWRQGVLEVLSVPQRRHTPLQVGLANLPALPRKEAAAAMSQYCRNLTKREAYVRKNMARARAKGQLPWHAELMFDLSLTMTRAELAWVKAIVKGLSSKRKGASYA